MLGVFVFPLCLLLPSVGGSEFPDFGDDYDYYENYYVCEGDACAYRSISLWVEKTIQVPNKTVTFEENDYFDVDAAGLLADCAPSLSIGDIANKMKSCTEVNWKLKDACKYRKKGWLDQDGKTFNESLGTDFKEIEGVSENIMKCLAWDGVDDYDYDYYWDDHYDYGLEESDEVQVRAKREQKPNVPEFMIQKTRLKRRTDEKANIRKEENRLVKKRGNRKGKNKGNFGKKSGKKGKKSGKKGKKHGPRRKQSARKGKKGGKFRHKSGKKSGKDKGRRNSGERKHKGAEKANKRKKNGRNKKKKRNNKNNENKKKKEERKKKKKERKLLKELGYDSMPSKEILNQLDCVESAIQYGLEKCGEKIFENL